MRLRTPSNFSCKLESAVNNTWAQPFKLEFIPHLADYLVDWPVGLAEVCILYNEYRITLVDGERSFFKTGRARSRFVVEDFTKGSHLLTGFDLASDGESFMFIWADV